MGHLVRAHRHPLHRPRRPHATLQRAPRRPPTPSHTGRRRARQRDHRRSLSNARPSARSSRSANPRRGRGSRGSRRGRGTPAWFPTNVARNSPTRLSNFEIRSLQFQRFQGISKTDQDKLRATFRGGTVAPAREIAAHPHGSPQMSHVIPQTILQTLKSGRCNSNVFRAYRKLTEGNYVRLFGEERLPLPARSPHTRMVPHKCRT